MHAIFQNRDRANAKNPQQKQQHSGVESEAKSASGSEDDENVSSVSTASNENQSKTHVEFTEAEIIAPETNTVFKVLHAIQLNRLRVVKFNEIIYFLFTFYFQHKLSTGKLAAQPPRKTSTSKSPGSGILVNKSTTASKPAPPTNGTIETLNNFDKIQPKDDLEIKKHRDESLGRTATKKENKKNAGKQSKKDNNNSNSSSAATATNNNIEKTPLNGMNDVINSRSATILEVSTPKESPKVVASKEKPNKKKRNDALLVQQLGKY